MNMGRRDMDEIKIENLEVYAYHGVYPEETKNGQTFYVSLTMYTDTRNAGTTDSLDMSTNYGEVCQFIYDWMKRHTVKLIETVAEKLAKALLLKFDLIKELDIEIKKPDAPIQLPFESVSVRIHRGWHQVYLSIGSNMGNRQEYIETAVKQIQSVTSIKDVKCSSLLTTKPYGGVEQEDFLNGAISFKTLLTPQKLLLLLNELELHAGRKREIHWGPRTLDLDIIFYDKLVYEDEKLIIPHVDMQNRYFVLKPLSEIAPFYRHPILGKTVNELLQGLNSAE